jgi:hypothetical protein
MFALHCIAPLASRGQLNLDRSEVHASVNGTNSNMDLRPGAYVRLVVGSDDVDGRSTPRDKRGVLGNVVECDAHRDALRKTNPVEGLTLASRFAPSARSRSSMPAAMLFTCPVSRPLSPIRWILTALPT